MSSSKTALQDKAVAELFAKLQGDMASGRGISFASIGGGDDGNPLHVTTGRMGATSSIDEQD